MHTIIKQYFEEQHAGASRQSKLVFAQRQLDIKYGIDQGTLKLRYERQNAKRLPAEQVTYETWVIALGAIKLWVVDALALYDFTALTPLMTIRSISTILIQKRISHHVYQGNIEDVFGADDALKDHVWLTLCDGMLTVDYHLGALLEDPYMPSDVFLTSIMKRATYHPHRRLPVEPVSEGWLARLRIAD